MKVRTIVSVFALIVMAIVLAVPALAGARGVTAPDATPATPSAWYVTTVTRDDFGDNIVAYDLNSRATRVLREAPYSVDRVTSRGAWAAWTEATANDPSVGSDLWIADLHGGAAKMVSSGSGHVFSPCIAGDRLSWVEQTASAATVHVLVLSTGAQRRVGPDTGYQWLLGASRNWVVWTRGSYVRLLDAVAGTSRLFGRGWPSSGVDSLVAGTWATWPTRRGSGLLARNLADGRRRLICRSGARTEQASDIAVSTTVVTWLDYRRGGVRAVGLGSGRHHRVTSTSDIYAIAAWKSWVIWQRGRTHQGIYAANLATGQRLRLCGAKDSDNGPELVGPWVVWSGARTVGGETVFHARNLEDGRRATFTL